MRQHTFGLQTVSQTCGKKFFSPISVTSTKILFMRPSSTSAAATSSSVAFAQDWNFSSPGSWPTTTIPLYYKYIMDVTLRMKEYSLDTHTSSTVHKRSSKVQTRRQNIPLHIHTYTRNRNKNSESLLRSHVFTLSKVFLRKQGKRKGTFELLAKYAYVSTLPVATIATITYYITSSQYDQEWKRSSEFLRGK